MSNLFGFKSAARKVEETCFHDDGTSTPVYPEDDEEDYQTAMNEVEVQRAKWTRFLRNKKDIWSETWLWNRKERTDFSDKMLKKKFLQIFSSKVKTQKRVKMLIRGGVPPELRGKVWWACSGAGEKMATAAPEEKYEAMLQRIDTLSGTSIGNDIEKDLLRTFPERINAGDTGTIDKLRRVLRAYALRCPEIGYCQSMNYLCALLLLHMCEEQAFWAFCALIEDVLPPDYFTPSLIGGRVDQQVFQSCIAWKLPKVYSVFKDTNTMLEPIICPWFLCLYINVLPLSVVCRIWDCMFWEGNVVLFRIGLSLIKSKADAIIKANDFVAIYMVLKISNNKTYSFELENRDSSGNTAGGGELGGSGSGTQQPGSPNRLSYKGNSPHASMTGLDAFDVIGSISRAEHLISSAFGYRWLKSVPKAKVEVLREKFLRLLNGNRADRLANGGSTNGSGGSGTYKAHDPTVGSAEYEEESSPSSSSLSAAGRSVFGSLFRMSTASPKSADSAQKKPREVTFSPSADAIDPTVGTPSKHLLGGAVTASMTATAGAASNRASTSSGNSGDRTSNRSNKSGGSARFKTRQSTAMLKLLDEFE
jgi:hypothetical protein